MGIKMSGNIEQILMLNGSRDKFYNKGGIEHDSIWSDLMFDNYNNDDTFNSEDIFITNLNKG